MNILISALPGLGKSFLAREDKRFVDVEDDFAWYNPNLTEEPGWTEDEYVVDMMKHHALNILYDLGDTRTILASWWWEDILGLASHKHVIVLPEHYTHAFLSSREQTGVTERHDEATLHQWAEDRLRNDSIVVHVLRNTEYLSDIKEDIAPGSNL
jgi:hypothetical protein